MFKLIILIKAILLVSTPLYASTKINTWVDYDVSIGKVIRDVDDGYALITAIQSNELDIKGISVGFGNIKSVDYMEKVTKKILRITNTKIPVYKGAEDQSEIFKITEATIALANELEKNPLSIMAMGRLTNMASLIKNYPHLKSNIKEIIINAGRRLETETEVGKQKVIMPDTNIDDHVEAIKFVLESGVKIVMLPVEVMKDKFINRRHLRMMRKGTKTTKYMARNAYIWRLIWRVFPNSEGFIPWDVFIVTYLTHPHKYKCDDNIPTALRRLKNNTSSLFRSKYRKKYKDFLVASYSMSETTLGKYCYEMDEDHLDNIVKRWINY